MNEAAPQNRRPGWLPVLAIFMASALGVAVLLQLVNWGLFSPWSKSHGEDCLRYRAQGPADGIPFCRCQELVPEDGLVQYRFNRQGFRSDYDFGPKPTGVYRIVLFGASTAAGFRVTQDRIFAHLLESELTRRTGRPVEVYNEALPGRIPSDIATLLGESLISQPDLVLWTFSPFEIRTRRAAEAVLPPAPHSSGGPAFVRWATDEFRQMEPSLLPRHLLFSSPTYTVQSALANGDDQFGYLRAAFSPVWKERMDRLDASAGAVAAVAGRAKVPVAAVLLPSRAQLSMIATHDVPAGYDPMELSRRIRVIASAHGMIAMDILPGFTSLVHPERLCFPNDPHPTAAGHAAIASLLAPMLARQIQPAAAPTGQDR